MTTPENANPELLPGETPLEERLADAAADVADATDRFERLSRTAWGPASLREACLAGTDLGRAVLKVVTILRQEARANAPDWGDG